MSQESKKIIELMNQQFKELTTIYHQAVSQYGISDSEFWIWYALLSAEGERTQQEICDMWSLSKQTVNSIIYRMMKKGHIYLEPILGTHNKKAILLTETGREFGNGIFAHIHGAEQRAMERLPLEELQSVTRLFANYINFLNEEI